MSAYSTNKTQFKDVALLRLALAEMGFTGEMVEVNDTGKQLFDFQGTATHYTEASGDKAHVIIRRRFIGRLANDIGFRRGADGHFEALLSAYDKSCGYNEAWLGKLSAAYARNGIIQKAQKQGLRFAGTVKKDGKTQLQFVDGRI
jgi:hypothetical protein